MQLMPRQIFARKGEAMAAIRPLGFRIVQAGSDYQILVAVDRRSGQAWWLDGSANRGWMWRICD